jgi:hypothetical protein
MAITRASLAGTLHFSTPMGFSCTQKLDQPLSLPICRPSHRSILPAWQLHSIMHWVSDAPDDHGQMKTTPSAYRYFQCALTAESDPQRDFARNDHQAHNTGAYVRSSRSHKIAAFVAFWQVARKSRAEELSVRCASSRRVYGCRRRMVPSRTRRKIGGEKDTSIGRCDLVGLVRTQTNVHDSVACDSMFRSQPSSCYRFWRGRVRILRWISHLVKGSTPPRDVAPHPRGFRVFHCQAGSRATCSSVPVLDVVS